MSSAGMVHGRLECQSNGLSFCISMVGLTGKKLDKLPDPFIAQCLFCKHEHEYPKSAVQFMYSIGRN